MKIFKLPDLGEGLPDAIIREWHVNVGDTVKTDQPIVSMETAKALVEVPAPFDAKIEKLFGQVDDTIETGHPLVGFEGEAEAETKDSGTVVGAIQSSNQIISEAAAGVSTQASTNKRAKVTPKIRSLAKHLGVDISAVEFSGERITEDDIKRAANSSTQSSSTLKQEPLSGDLQKLTLMQQAMALSMTQSHQSVVPVTLSDEVDISVWKGKDNITLRLIRAVQQACDAEPMLNASYDSKQATYRLNKEINLGIAVDTEHGLYVPILKNIAKMNDETLRETINRFKEQAQTKSIPQNDLHGGTIILSNFGTIAGKTATPVVVPPMTAIVGIGKLYDAVIAVNGSPTVRPVLPISVTADHRIITGGQLARFLRTMMDSLKG